MVSKGMDQERMDAFAQLTMLRSAIANIAPGDQELTVIDDMMAKLHSRQYVVAVVGEFNRGKSSLINALLGMNVLPADITPTTATINRVVYSDLPYAKLQMRNGHVEDIPLTMLKGRVTKLSEEAQSAAEQVDEAVIGYPTVFCRNNISILDTPGLNESAAMDELTFERTQQADALIYTIHALIPFSDSEAEAVCRLLEYPNIRHILFTVGFIDQVPTDDRERMLTLIRKRIIKLTDRLIAEDGTLTDEEAEHRKAIIHHAVVLGVSAKMALDAFVNGSMEQLQASGIEEYKKALMMRLTAQQDEWVAFEILPYLEKTTSTFREAAQRSLDAMDERIAKAQDAISAARPMLEMLPTEAIKAGIRWKDGLIRDVGSVEECAQKLRDIIRSRLEMETRETETAEESKTPLTNEFHQASPGGLFGWIKQKTKEVGLYRESSDPRSLGIEVGFNVAKMTVTDDWIPVINDMARTGYAEFCDFVQRAAQSTMAQLHTAQGVLKPSQDEQLNEPMFHMPTGDLLTAAFARELCALQAGNLSIGTVDIVIQRLARMLSDRLYTAVLKRVEEVRQPVLFKARDVRTDGLAKLAALEVELERLRQKRDGLQSQIVSVQQFLLASQEKTQLEEGDMDEPEVQETESVESAE